MGKRINIRDQPAITTSRGSLNYSAVTPDTHTNTRITIIPIAEEHHTQNTAIISYDDVATMQSIFNILIAIYCLFHLH